MIIQVEQRHVYGQIKYYPLNDLAQKFAGLIRQKTFDASNLRDIKAMGVAVVITAPVIAIETI